VKSSSLQRRSITLVLITCVLAGGCKKKASEQSAGNAQQAPPASAPASPSAASPPQSSADGAPSWIASPQISPGTVVLTARDPHTMTPSEVQFGVAPKHSPDVDYAPDAIIMEQGDRAIKSVASDGISWTFDANAPQVSDFQVGKIVFATGRAVGKVLSLQKNGSTVTAILGPIELTDVVTRGRFVMNQPVDADKMIAYVAPDWPGANDSASYTQTAMMDGSGAAGASPLVVSTSSHGVWTPTAMSRADIVDASSHQVRRHLPRWARENFARYDRELAALRRKQAPGVPGMPQGVPRVPSIPMIDPGASKALGAVPSVNVNNNDVRIENVANNSYVGVTYYFVPKGSKMAATAQGLISLESPVVRAVLVINHSHIDSAGISMAGAAGIRLRMDANSATDKVINFHLSHFVPIDFSIPLAGPLPISLTFATFFNINSAFSAKSSMMASEGEYTFSGGIWAGRANGQWTVAVPAHFTAVKSLGNTAAGLSLGINSATLAFGIRTMVGIGAFGFNTGAFATVRFGGSILLSPTESYSCRQGNIESWIDTGLGYQLPGFATAAINFFLTPITGKAIDAVGTLAKGPSQRMFTEALQIPNGCATPKTG
jgi:hypothetical protein